MNTSLVILLIVVFYIRTVLNLKIVQGPEDIVDTNFNAPSLVRSEWFNWGTVTESVVVLEEQGNASIVEGKIAILYDYDPRLDQIEMIKTLQATGALGVIFVYEGDIAGRASFQSKLKYSSDLIPAVEIGYTDGWKIIHYLEYHDIVVMLDQDDYNGWWDAYHSSLFWVTFTLFTITGLLVTIFALIKFVALIKQFPGIVLGHIVVGIDVWNAAIACLTGILHFAFLSDIFNEISLKIFLTLNWPSYIAGLVLVAFYWYETLQKSKMATRIAFISMLLIPFIIIVSILQISEIITIILRLTVTIDQTAVRQFHFISFIILLTLFTSIFFIQGYRLLKILSSGLQDEKKKRVRNATIFLMASGLANVIFIISLIVGLTPAYQNPWGSIIIYFMAEAAIALGSGLRVASFYKRSRGDKTHNVSDATSNNVPSIQ